MAASGLFLSPTPLEDFNSCSIRHKQEGSTRPMRHGSDSGNGNLHHITAVSSGNGNLHHKSTVSGSNLQQKSSSSQVFVVSAAAASTTTPLQHRQIVNDSSVVVDRDCSNSRHDSVLLLLRHKASFITNRTDLANLNVNEALFAEALSLFDVPMVKAAGGGSNVVNSVSNGIGIGNSIDVGRCSTKSEQFRYGLQSSCHRHTSFQLSKYPIFFEPSHTLTELVEHVKLGLHAGHAPQLSTEGSGGVYFMKDECGLQSIAVFKPMDEEPMAVNNPRGFSVANCGEGLRRGSRSGKGALREVAAYILDHPAVTCSSKIFKDEEKMDVEGFAGVPPTTMVKCYHKAFHYGSDFGRQRKAKTGSLQRFVDAVSSCEDMGCSLFPVQEVHKITVLDIRLANTDRNGGNILACWNKDGSYKLVPIDHGYCLPDKFEDCSFEWLYWPQAQQPYSQAVLDYIESLDAERDILLLQQCGWSLRLQLARILRVSTMLLKKGAKAGLTPFQIGSIMCRGGSLDEKSPLEIMLENAEAKHSSSKETDFLNIMDSLLTEYISSTLAKCR